jgi:hypothetical protein
LPGNYFFRIIGEGLSYVDAPSFLFARFDAIYPENAEGSLNELYSCFPFQHTRKKKHQPVKQKIKRAIKITNFEGITSLKSFQTPENNFDDLKNA